MIIKSVRCGGGAWRWPPRSLSASRSPPSFSRSRPTRALWSAATSRVLAVLAAAVAGRARRRRAGAGRPTPHRRRQSRPRRVFRRHGDGPERDERHSRGPPRRGPPNRSRSPRGFRHHPVALAAGSAFALDAAAFSVAAPAASCPWVRIDADGTTIVRNYGPGASPAVDPQPVQDVVFSPIPVPGPGDRCRCPCPRSSPS